MNITKQITTETIQKFKSEVSKELKVKEPLVHYAENHLFIEVIIPEAKNKSDKSDYIKKLIPIFDRIFCNFKNIWTVQVYGEEKETYNQRGCLHTVPDGYTPDGYHTTVLSEKDAFIMLKEIDVEFIEFCSTSYQQGLEPIDICFIQDDSNGFKDYQVKKQNKYSVLEVKGTTYKVIDDHVETANDGFKIKIEPSGRKSFSH